MEHKIIIIRVFFQWTENRTCSTKFSLWYSNKRNSASCQSMVTFKSPFTAVIYCNLLEQIVQAIYLVHATHAFAVKVSKSSIFLCDAIDSSCSSTFVFDALWMFLFALWPIRWGRNESFNHSQIYIYWSFLDSIEPFDLAIFINFYRSFCFILCFVFILD